MNYVKPEMPVSRINRQLMTQPIFKIALLTLKEMVFDFGCFKTVLGIFCPPNMHDENPINVVAVDVNVVPRY